MILMTVTLLLVTGAGWGQKTIRQIKREKTEKALRSNYRKTTNTKTKANLKKLSDDGAINGHAYVDLGLPSGIKWATCNVGASAPEQYGNYYAWGETATKERYDGNNRQVNGSRRALKEARIIDKAGNLMPSHDAARVVWGSTWRLPTMEEMEELKDLCKWTRIVRDGIEGFLVTGPNEHTIFLPLAGWQEGKRLVKSGGTYWSATPFSNSGTQAYSMFFAVDIYVHNHYMGDGCTIRPVSE